MNPSFLLLGMGMVCMSMSRVTAWPKYSDVESEDIDNEALNQSSKELRKKCFRTGLILILISILLQLLLPSRL